MQKNTIKEGFTAEECNFQGLPGYMVKQYYNNTVICSQFIVKSVYDEFCNKTGIKPIIL